MKTPNIVSTWMEAARKKKSQDERDKEDLLEFRRWIQTYVPEGYALNVRADYSARLDEIESNKMMAVDSEFFKNLTPKTVSGRLNTLIKGLHSESTVTSD